MAKSSSKETTYEQLTAKVPSALGDTVLIESLVSARQETTVGGIVVVEEETPTDIILARVLSVGDEATCVKVGDAVYASKADIERLGHTPWTESKVVGFVIEDRIHAKA